jgi:hypothetical protein
MSARPRLVAMISVLVGLNSLFWLAFGLLVAFNFHPALPDAPIFKPLLVSVSLALAGLQLSLLVLLRRRSRVAYLLAVGLFTAIALAFFFDQFGWIDLAVLLLDLAPLVLLIKERAWYWPGTPPLAA